MNIEEIARNTEQRYTERYRKLGKHIRTLGWGNEEQQQYRFRQTLSYIEPEQTILDIGCGFGDYLLFLQEEDIDFRKYIGWDINKHFIEEARKTNTGRDKQTFEVFDILKEQTQTPEADIGVMLGLLNWKFDSEEENYDFSKKMITNAFSFVKKTLIVDFLSTKITPEYPKEDAVFYHDPSRIINFALSLTDNIEIKHNYAPIPQKEFLLILTKDTHESI